MTIKMKVIRDWVFEQFGPAKTTASNPRLTAGEIIEVSPDFARKLGSREVAVVYRGKELGVPFPPVVYSGDPKQSSIMADIEREIAKSGASGGQANDGGDTGGAKGPVNPPKG